MNVVSSTVQQFSSQRRRTILGGAIAALGAMALLAAGVTPAWAQ
jgi:hypothetical protein